MSIHIAPGKFEDGHKKFLQHMLSQLNGIPFTNFQHQFLVEDEIDYKKIIYGKAKGELSLKEWKKWLKTPGNIIKATKAACAPNVSKNLLYHRKGFKSSSEQSLYKVETPPAITELEQQLYNFFLGGASTPAELGPRFDAFANYLRQNSLGCNWRFIAYLAFLINDEFYFPVVPENFDALLGFYEIPQKLMGFVSWERYNILLELAALLRDKLAIYGQASMIEIQSYMWVVSYLIKDIPPLPIGKTQIIVPDFAIELKARQQRADERERIGLLGEKFVFEQEKEKLITAGLSGLADNVRLVSQDDYPYGYDIVSYTLDEKPLHIEVKSTTRSPSQDEGFWLTDNEKHQAEGDNQWCIYRVWNVDSKPNYQNLGNIVRQGDGHWEMRASNWFVKRKI